MSDPLDEAYDRLLKPHSEVEIETKVTCPKCDSENVDMSAGYRGEYECLDCGHRWQVGGTQAT